LLDLLDRFPIARTYLFSLANYFDNCIKAASVINDLVHALYSVRRGVGLQRLHRLAWPSPEEFRDDERNQLLQLPLLCGLSGMASAGFARAEEWQTHTNVIVPCRRSSPAIFIVTVQFSLLTAPARHSWARERTSAHDVEGPFRANFSRTAGLPSRRTARWSYEAHGEDPAAYPAMGRELGHRLRHAHREAQQAAMREKAKPD
jgi:hypothetical protein